MIDTGWAWAVAALAVTVGATLQRVSGAGVGLVVAPTLALLMGPTVGVFLTNATTTVSATILTIAVRRRIQWRRAAGMLAAGLPGAALGAWLVAVLPAPWLSIVIGTTVLAAFAVTFTARRLPHAEHPAALGVAGFVGGTFNTTAGIAAPALVIAARLTRWEHAGFAATLQPIFLGMGLMSVVFKWFAGASGFAQLPPWWVAPLIVAAVLAGLGAGTWLDGRLSPARAQQLAFAIAGLGGVVAIARGTAQLLA